MFGCRRQSRTDVYFNATDGLSVMWWMPRRAIVTAPLTTELQGRMLATNTAHPSSPLAYGWVFRISRTYVDLQQAPPHV